MTEDLKDDDDYDDDDHQSLNQKFDVLYQMGLLRTSNGSFCLFRMRNHLQDLRLSNLLCGLIFLELVSVFRHIGVSSCCEPYQDHEVQT